MKQCFCSIACALVLLPCGLANNKVPPEGTKLDRQRLVRLLTALARRCQLPSKRQVTFTMPEIGAAGGFGDRLLGMVTTYYVAVMTDSKFFINWTRPYNLNNYFDILDCAAFQRNRNAATRYNDINSKAAEVHAIDVWTYFENGAFLQDAYSNVNIATNARHWHDIVSAAAVKDRARALGLNTLSRRNLFELALRALLRPKSHVTFTAQAVLQKLSTLNGHRNRAPWYVGVQIRCGSEGGLSWSDDERHSLRDVPCFVREAVRACSDRTICPIFLTADSVSVASLFKAELSRHRRQTAGSGVTVAYIVAEADGPILHTDRTDTHTLDAGLTDPWLRSIVDWWLLQHASHLVISRSGFGETAAWASSSAQAARRVELKAPGACNVSDFTTSSVF